jgi:hypothetical protein
MQIFPRSIVKNFQECRPGQLVRKFEHNGSPLALVAECGNDKDPGLVFLEQKGISYRSFQHGSDFPVLVFDDELVWTVDHAGAIEPPFRELYEQQGALVCTRQGWFLNAARFGSSDRYAGKRYGLSSGDLDFPGHDNYGEICAFGSWSLSLQDKNRPETGQHRIFEFNATSIKSST